MLARTLRSDSSFPTRRNLRKIQVLCSILAILLLAAPSGAQQQGQSQGQQGPPRPGTPPAEPAPPQNPGPVTLPAGTQLVLILTHPIDSKAMHRGSIVFAETTAPVLLDDQMIIPAGAFVQGNVEKVARQGSRAELAMQSVSVALSDGSVINMQGPLEITSGEGTAWRNPGNAAKAGALLGPFVGLGLGSAIGAAAHTTQTTTFAGMTMTSPTPRGIAIGSAAGLAAGTIVSFVMVARSRHFFVGEGSPLEMILPHSVTLARVSTGDATGASGDPQ